MKLYKRPNSPNWYITTVSPDGKRLRVSLGETDKRAAQRKAARLEAARSADDEHIRDGKRPIKVVAALDQYVDHLRVSAKSWATGATLYAHKATGRLASSDGRWSLPADLYLHELTPAILESLKRARQAEGAAAASIGHELKVLRAASCYAQGLRYRGPDLVSWRLPKTVSKTRFLSWEDFERVFAYLEPSHPFSQIGRSGEVVHFTAAPGSRRWVERQDTQDLLVALTLCGGRWSEVSSLTWDRIDLAAGTIRLWGSKTNRERLVPLPDRLLAVLKRRYAASAGTLVFPGRDGGERSCGSQALRRAITAVGLNDPATVAQMGRATIHSLRHTFASWLVQNGADLAEVQDALGHTTLQMTRRYAHLAKGKTVVRLAGILNNVGA